MKFTKKMVEVIERAIDKKLTAEEIEKGKVETTLTRWYGNKKVVKIYRADNKKYMSTEDLKMTHTGFRHKGLTHQTKSSSRQFWHKIQGGIYNGSTDYPISGTEQQRL